MENYTISDFESTMPVRLLMQRLSHDRMKMHDFFEISMIVSGSGMLTLEDELYQFHPGDVFCVDPHTLHELRSADCVLVTVHFDQTAFEQPLPAPFHPSFFIVSSLQEHESTQNELAFRKIRSLIARMVKNNVDKLPGYELRTWSMIYALMDILYNNFRRKNSPARESRSYRYSLRIAQISSIIRDHYTENLTLADLSREVHLSVPYLSKFFTEHFGMNFLSYMTQFRLNHAVHELLNTDRNIDDIALESGFSSSHAFVTAFRREFDMLPAAYRRQEKNKTQSRDFIERQHSYIAGLKKYLQEDDSPAVIIPARKKAITFRRLPGTSHSYPLRHTWRTMATVGSAADVLLPPVQKMLRQLKSDTDFRYLRLNGIFSDRLMVVTRNSSGHLTFNFSYVDILLDFLLSAGIKPWIQLSFMPRVLALHPDKVLFNAIVSQPRSNEEWSSLVKAFLLHIRAKYGIHETESWMYSLWNLPDTSAFMYGFDHPQDFRTFYLATFKVLKEVDPAYSFSLPPSYYIVDDSYQNSYIDFLQWCSDNSCMPDSLSFAYYDTKLLDSQDAQTQETFGFPYTMALSENPDSFKQFVMQLSLEKRKFGLQNIPVYLAEWNNTPSQQDLLNDTCYKSCYIVKNVLENIDRLESYAFWSLSDLMSDAPIPESPFFGGCGLFTRSGIPKASYYAFSLLSGLGTSLLARGDGYFITEEQNAPEKGLFQILLYNYEHFSSLYANGEKFDMTRTDRYTVFADREPVTIHLSLENLPAGTYRISETFVNRNAGSVYDTWVRTGAPNTITIREEAYLRQSTHPGYTERSVQTDSDGILHFDVTLELLEIRLLTLTPEDH